MYFHVEMTLMIANVITYVLCGTCDNFTLCLECFVDTKYTHHPAHEFTIQNEDRCDDIRLLKDVQSRLKPGRGLRHNARCDKCKAVFPFLQKDMTDHLGHPRCPLQMLQLPRLRPLRKMLQPIRRNPSRPPIRPTL